MLAMDVINPPDFRCRSKRFFFWMDGDTFFEVEGVVFRLHKALLTLKSEWFAALFDAPSTVKSVEVNNRMIVEGLTEQQPISLSGIKREEFELLLGAVYDENLTSSSLLSKDPLLAIFRLADMWLLDEIRQITLTKLHPYFSSSPLDKLRFATRYNVPEWTTEACMDFATRPAPLSPAEAIQLGQGIVFALVAARESTMRRRTRLAFFGSEQRWKCLGGQMARSRGCARQVLSSFRAALTVKVNGDGCFLVTVAEDGEEATQLDPNTSFSVVWNEAIAAQQRANRPKNPGLCEGCTRVFGDGHGPGAMAWLDYDADVALVQNQLRLL